MLWILLLILVLMSSAVFAQTEQNQIRDKTPSAIKLEEFGNEPSGYVKMLTDNFFIKLQNDPTLQGFIISYGPNKPIKLRERFLRNYILMRGLDSQKVTFVTGKFNKELKTEFWLVPTGADLPNMLKVNKSNFPTTATKFEEFGAVSIGNIRNFTDDFFLELANNPTARGYVINYGKTKLVLNREKVLRDRIKLRRIDASRITFVRGGNKKGFITELWIVPQGVEPPTP